MSIEPDSDGLRPNLGRGGRKKVPTILQMEATECGAACLAMILAHYGHWSPLEELRVRCGVSRDGSKAVNILRAAREYGLKANGFRREPGRIFDLPFPMILFWNFNHFVVLEGYRNGTYYLNDPAIGRRTVTAEEFDQCFTGVCLGFEPTAALQRTGGPPSALAGLWKRVGTSHVPLLLVCLVTLLLIVPGLAIPTITKVFIDDVLLRGSADWLAPLLIGLGLTAFLRGGLTWMQQAVLARLEVKMALTASAGFFWHIFRLPMEFFSQRYAGDIANRVSSNDRVAQIISSELATNAIGLITVSFYAIVMFFYDALLTVVAAGMTVINILALTAVSRIREDASRQLLKEQGKVAGASVNGLTMIETLKASGNEGDFFARWSGIQANTLLAYQKQGSYTQLLNVVPPLVATLTTVAILGYGGLRVMEGALTIGGLVAFQSLAQSFSQPIEGLIRFAGNLQTVKGDIARLDDVLNYEPEARAAPGSGGEDSLPPAAPVGMIDIRDLTFGYSRHEKPLIRNFNLSVKPGQRVALVGGSGSGKSTIARLACGLLRPWSGEVLIDRQDLTSIPPEALAQTVAFVDQDIILFEGTVQDNVTLWDSTVPEIFVNEALRDAAILDEIMERVGRHEAPVEEGGRNFSGGQRQRLEIARALANRPAILVLDEATAALDPLTELQIDDRIRQRGCTCLIVAHRVSTIRDADEIIVLDRGEIVERGTHESLVAADSFYLRLVQAE